MKRSVLPAKGPEQEASSFPSRPIRWGTQDGWVGQRAEWRRREETPKGRINEKV